MRLLNLFRAQANAVLPQSIPITLGSGSINAQIRATAAAKRLTLRVRPRERDLLISVPLRTKLTDILTFTQKYQGWIEAKLAKLPQVTMITDGAIIPLRGEPVTIRHMLGTRGNVWKVGNELHVAGDPIGLKRRVMTFLNAEAKRDLIEATFRYAQILDVSIENITVRDTKSRWGSCSSKGALNYSWRVIMAPPFVLDYLCAHEVSHRLEMNHSHRFWAHVERICPHMNEAEKWLKKNGAKLHLIG